MHPVNTVFGPVAVPHPRWHRCACQTEGPKTFRPTAVWLRGRTSPELLYLETKWGSLIPFERVADLLKEVLPVGDSTNHETVREQLQGIAERMEAELDEERQCDPFQPRKEEEERREAASHPGRVSIQAIPRSSNLRTAPGTAARPALRSAVSPCSDSARFHRLTVWLQTLTRRATAD